MSDLRVIRVCDLETTAIEIGWCDVVLDPELGAVVSGTGTATYVDPDGHEISPESQAVHHIMPDDLAGAPRWPVAVARMLAPCSIPVAALAAHVAKMERQWLTPEVTGSLPWICTYKAAKRLLSDAPSHSNQALRYWLKLSVRRSIADQAHRAGPDAYVTAHLLVELLKRASLEQLIEWADQPLLLTGKMGFGKHAEVDWSNCDPSYLEWMLTKDFDEDRTFTARYWIDQRRRARDQAALAKLGGAP